MPRRSTTVTNISASTGLGRLTRPIIAPRCTGRRESTSSPEARAAKERERSRAIPAARWSIASVEHGCRARACGPGFRRLAWPVLALPAPADARRFFVVRTGGSVSAVSPDGADASHFIDIASQTNSGYDETGLLGMAFHPLWQTNHQAFLFYSAHDGTKLDLTSTVSRFTSTDGGKTLDKSTEQVLFTLQKTPADNHNGGMIGFGPDGYLYIALGDGGGAGDILNHAQDTTQLFGKILRVDVDHGSPYSIPADNPFAAGTAGKPAIFAWCLRNPWRQPIDRATGVLWAGDVGQETWEEIDVIRKGENYGWHVREGAHCYPSGSSCSTSGPTDPVVEYAPTP